MSFFSGWLGYGTGVANGALIEPTDTGYARRPIVFGAARHGFFSDTLGGTVGPAELAWGVLTYAGVFDAAMGGNLIFWVPLATAVEVPAGTTFTEGAESYKLTLVGGQLADLESRTWAAGTTVATTAHGCRCIAGVALQATEDALLAAAPVFGTDVSFPNLPSSAGQAGRLWTNGGVISVS